MALLIQYVVGGLAIGSLYALVALGIVLLYRTSRVLNFAHGDLATFGTLVVEHPDSDEAKPLAGLARSFGNALRPALRKAGVLTAQDHDRLPRLHVCFVAGDHAILATSDPRDSAPWPMGAPMATGTGSRPRRSATTSDTDGDATFEVAGSSQPTKSPVTIPATCRKTPANSRWVSRRSTR